MGQKVPKCRYIIIAFSQSVGLSLKCTMLY